MPEYERIGRYELVETLGRGGASTVYRARDPVIGREVALKTLQLEAVGRRAGEYRARFEREARAAGRLDHPGIVRVYDVGEEPDKDLLFLSMEFVDGGTLRDVIDDGTPFEPWQAAELGARIAEALQAAHDAGIVHRDIKPANVLLGSGGTVKITDFGIARLGVSALTRSGSTVGTPFYMAPEQITARTVDGRADLYAVGVILYELLAGRRPFVATGIGELVHLIATEDPPHLSHLRPDLPEALTSVIHRCLAKSPGDRYDSGRAVAAALRDACLPPVGSSGMPWEEPGRVRPRPIVADSPVRTLPSTPVHTRDIDGSVTTRIEVHRHGGRRPLRRPMVLALGGLAVVAALLGAVLVAFMPRQTADLPAPSEEEAARLRETVTTLQRAGELLDAGDLEQAMAAATAVLAVDPGSPAARRIVARAEQELERRRRAELEQSLEASVRERLETTSRTVRASSATPAPAPPTPPSPPIMMVTFDSPFPRGTLVVEARGDRLDELRWDFTEPGFLGIRKGEGGHVRGEIELPTGDSHLRVELHAGRRGQVGAEDFEHHFGAGSRWRLTVVMESRHEPPRFTLEPIEDATP